MRPVVARLSCIGWVGGAYASLFDRSGAGIVGVRVYVLIKGWGEGVGTANMMFAPHELVYVGYWPGREPLMIQLLKDLIVPLNCIVGICVVYVYLRAVGVVPYGTSMPCKKVR